MSTSVSAPQMLTEEMVEILNDLHGRAVLLEKSLITPQDRTMFHAFMDDVDRFIAMVVVSDLTKKNHHQPQESPSKPPPPSSKKQRPSNPKKRHQQEEEEKLPPAPEFILDADEEEDDLIMEDIVPLE
jgi:hypothetical protein